MRVLAFSPYARFTPHFETDLEILEGHISRGDEVAMLGCDRELESCDPNPGHKRSRCLGCSGARAHGLRLLSRRPEVASFGEYLDDADRRRLDALRSDFASLEELQSYQFDAMDLGFAAASSLIWSVRDADLDLREHSSLLRGFLRASASTYLGVRNYLSRVATDRVYLFNGRMGPMRGALRASQEAGVDCYVHERGCDLNHYLLCQNAMPHERQYFEESVHRAWEESNLPEEERAEIASNWFESRSRGEFANWHSFTAQQRQGQLPEGFRDEGRNVALFVSSEYEYASISDDWRNPLFRRPSEGIAQIAEEIEKRRGELHLYIRMHPNPDTGRGRAHDRIAGLGGRHVSVIRPSSSISSYALLHACEKTVTTSSTMGIEATFWRKPSIQAGRSIYSGLRGAYLPDSFGELMALIDDPKLPAVERHAADLYGYYQATFGTLFRYFQADGVCSGSFKGERLLPSRVERRRIRALRMVELPGVVHQKLGRWRRDPANERGARS